ncbi:MAG: transglutaminase-like cysteine peptidase [Gammaproteobacteria bacterium]|nr:transglutaminase-like cysteine peptidase [Gammaproteobacteria bacterium]MDH5653959.1 transglutaminase-like cysteine peptidase [Gammaproteobacteria bacterium]
MPIKLPFLFYTVVSATGIMLPLLVSWVFSPLNKRNDEHHLDGLNKQQRRNWRGRHQNIPLRFYGGGCDKVFSHWLEGDSQVQVSSLDEIADWLVDCRYMSDLEHMGVRDHWQHPLMFEQLRTGDCEDFALWAWRKMIELGYECEFMVGKWLRNGRAGTHAWIVYQQNDQIIIFETTGVSKDRMFKPLAQAAGEYIPFASVDHQVRKKVYPGIADWILRLGRQISSGQ